MRMELRSMLLLVVVTLGVMGELPTVLYRIGLATGFTRGSIGKRLLARRICLFARHA